MSMYHMDIDELLPLISEKLKNPITEEDVFGKQIKLSHLKRIDKIFNKGLNYYLIADTPEPNKEASIFFRKDKFGTDLNIGAKKIVNQFENLKFSISAISKLSDLKLERYFKSYSTNDNPKEVAKYIREIVNPNYNKNPKNYLQNLINKLADFNVFVFEFVETWNKKNKANIDGFFLKPNLIVLKRQQRSFRRELFTLAHELGHYLLEEEEVEAIDYKHLENKNLSEIESWCNDFAFYFLLGDLANQFNELNTANAQNDYHHEWIEQIKLNTHLSSLAIYTRMLIEKKISYANYRDIKNEMHEEYLAKKENERIQKELDKELGKKIGGSAPKPMYSPLLISTLQTAYYEGVINEQEFCKTLNIPAQKLDKYLESK